MDIFSIFTLCGGLAFFLYGMQVMSGGLENVDVVINAGYAGSAWSGGEEWKDEAVVSALTKWVYEGGSFIGVNEPSAVEGYDTFFRMAHVLGVDEDTGARVCHGKWSFDADHILPEGVRIKAKEGRYLTDGRAKVLLAEGERLLITENRFGRGMGIYLAGFEVNPMNTRMLYQLLLYAGGEKQPYQYMTDNCQTECAYYPQSRKLVVINNSEKQQTTSIQTHAGKKEAVLKPYETIFMEL